MGTSALRLNMTSLNRDREEEARRYQAAVRMASYVDRNGFDVVNMEEHHCADNGWMASPLTMAAMVAAVTDNVGISVTALLITLYDPVRLAEDIAVIDAVSQGRFTFVAGQGYRPIEHHAMDKDWEQRGAEMDRAIETLLQAWKGEPFEYRGQTVRVSPPALTQPNPLMLVGGMGKNAARRAARFGLPFSPPTAMPELEALYYAELEKHGNTGFVFSPPSDSTLLFIHQDPDQAWAEYGQHFVVEAKEYASWARPGVPRPFDGGEVSAELLREQGLYEIITPEECRLRHHQNENYIAALHPLVGGMPLDAAWACLELYVDEVLAP